MMTTREANLAGSTAAAVEQTQPFNAEQQRAIGTPARALRVIAGAGTGKTTVISARFADLVESRGVAPERILAVTFSRKAAEELRDRIVADLARGYRQLWAQTFHAFCLRVLREEALRAGAGVPRVLAEVERRALLTRLVVEDPAPRRYYRGAHGATRLVADGLTLSSRAKDHLIDPERFATFAREQGGERLAELATLFARYQRALTDAGAVDFAEIGYRVVRILASDDALRRRWAGRFDHIIVDEFQDTNEGQYRLLTLLAPPGGPTDLCVVGDPDQAIYAFRGAARGYMTRLADDYPDLETVSLPANYRSQPHILAVANALIAQNPDDAGGGGRVPLRTTTRPGVPVHLAEVATGEDEASHVAATIGRGIADGRFRARDCAILCRSLKLDGPSLAAALAARGIPYHLNGLAAADYVTIEDLLAALRVVAGTPTWADWRRLLACRGGGASALATFDRWCDDDTPTGDARPADASMFATADPPFGPTLGALAVELRAIAAQPLAAAVYRALLATGHLTDAPTLAQAELTRALLAEAEAGSALPLPAFIDYLAAGYAEADDEPPGQGTGVVLLTAHAAKGLEWPVVFVVGLAEGRFPLPMRLDRAFDLDELARWQCEGAAFAPLAEAEREVLYREEERRLAYVAMTRARQELHLSRARRYGEDDAPAAPFLAEIADLAADTPAAPLARSDAAREPATATELARDLYRAMRAACDAPAAGPALPVHLGAILTGGWSAGHVPGAVPLRRRTLPMHNGPETALTLSYSQLDTYASCPRQYLYKHVLRVRRDEDAPHAVYGSAVHLTLQALNRAWQETGAPPASAAIADAVAAAFTSKGIRFGVPGLAEQAHERALHQIGRLYAAEHGRGRHPVAIEEAFTLPYGAHTFRGFIDCVLQDRDGRYELIDYKTGRGDALDPVGSLQLFIYEWYWRTTHPEARIDLAYSLLRHPDDKGRLYAPRWSEKQRRGHTHTVATHAAVRERLDAHLAGILANRFVAPPDLDPKVCSRCGFSFLCPESLA